MSFYNSHLKTIYQEWNSPHTGNKLGKSRVQYPFPSRYIPVQAY